jgi:hypothetical protein
MNHQIMDMDKTAVTQKSTKPFISTQVLLICLGVAALAITAVAVFKVSIGNLFFVGALLACPLIHVLMMKDMHKHD